MQSVYWNLSSSRVAKGFRLASCPRIGTHLCSCKACTNASWLEPQESEQCRHVCRLYMIS